MKTFTEILENLNWQIPYNASRGENAYFCPQTPLENDLFSALIGDEYHTDKFYIKCFPSLLDLNKICIFRFDK